MPVRAWFLLLLSALLQVLLFPTPNLFYLGWIAFVPWLLLLYQRPSTKRAFFQDIGAGWVCGILWYFGTCYWIYHAMRTHGDLGVVASAFVLSLFCLYLGLYHALFAGLVSYLRLRRMPLKWIVLLTPVLWVAVELARTRVTAYPWCLLGYTQVDNLSLTRIAPLTGVYGLSFLVMLVNATFAGAFGRIRLSAEAVASARVNRRSPALALVSIVAAITLQSGAFLRLPAAKTDHLAILVQQDLPLEFSNAWTSGYFDHTMVELIQESEPEQLRSAEGTRLIVWPESPAPFFVSDPRFDHWMEALAEDAHAWVIAGAIGTLPGAPPRSAADAEVIYNSAALFTPTGRLGSRYDKVHLVPFGEYVPFVEYFQFAASLTRDVGTFSRGSSRRLLEAGDIRAGTFICYESVFPDEVRLFAKNGANVLVNISNDGWFGDSGAAAQHLRMARMRAIENNRWLLRSTNSGITAVVDPLGREVESAPTNVRYTLQAHYALIADSQTFYSVHGDLFAYLCAILTIVALIIASVRRFNPQIAE